MCGGRNEVEDGEGGIGGGKGQSKEDKICRREWRIKIGIGGGGGQSKEDEICRREWRLKNYQMSKV